MILCKRCGAELPDGAVYCCLCGHKQIREAKRQPRRPNGTGCAYKRGSTWTARVIMGYDDNNKPITRSKGGFAAKTDALNYIPALRNQTVEKVRSLSYYWKQFSTHALLKISKQKQTHYRTAYKKIKDIAFSDIKTFDIKTLQSVVDNNAKTYYPAKDIRTLLSKLLSMAIADGVILTNLAKFIVIPSPDEVSPDPFTSDEINKMWIAYSNGDITCGYAIVMIYTGMMTGELLKLEKTMIKIDKREIVGAGLKTKKRKSTPIVIADVIVPVIEDLSTLTGGNKFLNCCESKFYADFKNSMIAAGCRPLSPYSCRHTTATALALLKVSPPIIKEVMRHTKFSTTEKYIQPDTTAMLEAVNEIKRGT